MAGIKYLPFFILFILALLYLKYQMTLEGFEAPPAKPTTLKQIDDIPIIKDVWIINLDKSKDRWNDILEQVKVLDPLPVNRWSATDGRAMKEQDFIDEKIEIVILY